MEPDSKKVSVPEPPPPSSASCKIPMTCSSKNRFFIQISLVAYEEVTTIAMY